ncbi:MAG: hypothetical protein IKW52_04235 [Alistipes sp.]|nr:hypothetical protein [Alistipes sp.]
MKRLFIIALCAAAASACTNKEAIKIDEQGAMNAAYDLSYELATRVVEADSHASFIEARAELEAYEEAFRTQIGGEEYEIFIEECNYILNEN